MRSVGFILCRELGDGSGVGVRVRLPPEHHTTIGLVSLKLPRLWWLLVPLAYVLYFYGLDATGLLGPDEPRYAAIGREMARSGDWVTPRLWGEAWFEKPLRRLDRRLLAALRLDRLTTAEK